MKISKDFRTLRATIETNRLILRPPQRNDLAWILQSLNTGRVTAHIGGIQADAKIVEEKLERDIKQFSIGRRLSWTIWTRAEQLRVGRCSLYRVNNNLAPKELLGCPEIGWVLDERAWGHGYALEAASAVLKHFWMCGQDGRVYAQTSDSNTRSTKLLMRLNFNRHPEHSYDDPNYPAADNPTSVWSVSE
ncbi:GNAT family N-acetyltransferase [Qipengyuania sphaerica]|uniref:GNAT family N-acetyltransferase n=1 Tax=Qipengyuania sphaerica TaxID=2867243 RepID=UPI001C8901FA|nr:GNAT family N-acetyltransferase [Qipengyuania sphaerica]MBX7541993.1 GNAT family N-acetyltransferase [Qipengyuania sphaerica]